jgi:O-antigen/teichoic acid export membrane protein
MNSEQKDTNRIKQLFVQGVAWRTVADFLIRLRSIILLPILTRTFGAADYGVWTQIGNTVTMLSSLGTFGLGGALNRYLPGLQSKEQKQQFWMVISVLMLGGLLVATPILIFAEALAQAFFGGSANAIFVQLGVLLMLIKLMQTHLLLYFKLSLRINVYSGLLIFQSILALIGYLGAALVGKNLLAVVSIAIIVDLIITVIVLIWIARVLGFGRPDFSSLRKYLVYGLPTLPLGFLNWALNSSDRFAVAYFLGPEELAIYAVAYGISIWSIQVVVTPIWTAVPGALNNLWNTGRQDEAISMLKTIFKFYFLGVTPIFSIIFYWGEFIIVNYAGESYGAGAVIIIFVLTAYLIEYTSSFYRTVLAWYEKTKVFLWTFSITALGNLVLNLILIPRYGIVGAAMSTTAAYSLLFIFELIISRRIHKVDLPYGQALSTLGLGLLTAGVVSRLPMDGWLAFFGQLALFILVFLTLGFAFRLIRINELRAISEFLRKKERHTKA